MAGGVAEVGQRRPRGQVAVCETKPWRDPAAVPHLCVQGVTKRFGEFTAVDDISVDIHRSEFFALLGPSGCGKTTLLRMLAGFETPDEGRILLDGEDLSRIAPYERPVNMMFQSYALFPHMSVARNIEFGLEMEKMPKPERQARVEEMLSLTHLEALAKRRPHQLSGGQRQRVALARALAKKPKLLLLDEPLGALDRKLREATQFELVNIQESLGLTFVIVTHDQEEAMTVSTRIAVMQAGKIAQLGEPREIYEAPRSRYVADFIGDINIFDGVADGQGRARFDLGFELDLPGPARTAGRAVAIAIRPEKMTLARAEDASGLTGTVEDIAYLGDISVYHVRVGDEAGQGGGRIVKATRTNRVRADESEITWEDRVRLDWAPSAVVLLED